MRRDQTSIAFGPVPSRRLGKSIGINNIPPKICTYACLYCQLGRTLKMQGERQAFYDVEKIFQEVQRKVHVTVEKKEPIDYLTFVPDGEPTLDINLGKEIERVKSLGIKVAVITNASLLWRDNVREDVSNADWVSVKIDAIRHDVWRRVNRAHKSLTLEKILQGITLFSTTFQGELATESMIIKGVNDSVDELENIADFITTLHPKKSYLSIPTRPPAEQWVEPADEETLTSAYQIFHEKGINVELITGYEGNAFSSTGNLAEDILSITAVHPLREDGITELLKKTGERWEVIEDLVTQGKIVETEYKNKKFYIRKFKKESTKRR
ncbi:MAG: radical SAM protein [Candidatus Thermoplasmatota archaeon]|nr:radical SAM protein [Candidatus Thermoplasmatota archaeon]